MTGAVEAVAAHAVLFVPLVGQRIDIGMFRHGLVEGGVEDGHMRHVGQDRLGRLDAGDIRRVVQRAPGAAPL